MPEYSMDDVVKAFEAKGMMPKQAQLAAAQAVTEVYLGIIATQQGINERLRAMLPLPPAT